MISCCCPSILVDVSASRDRRRRRGWSPSASLHPWVGSWEREAGAGPARHRLQQQLVGLTTGGVGGCRAAPRRCRHHQGGKGKGRLERLRVTSWASQGGPACWLGIPEQVNEQRWAPGQCVSAGPAGTAATASEALLLALAGCQRAADGRSFDGLAGCRSKVSRGDSRPLWSSSQVTWPRFVVVAVVAAVVSCHDCRHRGGEMGCAVSAWWGALRVSPPLQRAPSRTCSARWRSGRSWPCRHGHDASSQQPALPTRTPSSRSLQAGWRA